MPSDTPATTAWAATGRIAMIGRDPLSVGHLGITARMKASPAGVNIKYIDFFGRRVKPSLLTRENIAGTISSGHLKSHRLPFLPI